MEDSYSVLARHYDSLMVDTDYAGYADFYERIIEKYAPSQPKRLIDLGCGTGSVSVLLAEKGFEVTGVDLSCEMLSAALKKASDKHIKMLLVEQDMAKLDCGENYGAAICSFDGINYLTKREELSQCFERTADSLCEGGVFVFDVNSKYKYENIIADNTFIYETEDLFLSWQNYYVKEKGICDFYLTFFEKHGEKWRRTDEYQRQRMYSDRTLRNALEKAGFEICERFSDISCAPVTDESERIFYVCRKK